MNVRACKQNHLCNYIHYRVFSPLEYACMHSFRSIMNGWCGCWKLLDASVLWIKYSIWLRAFVMFSHNTKRISMYYNSVIEKKVTPSFADFCRCFQFSVKFCYWLKLSPTSSYWWVLLMFMHISAQPFCIWTLSKWCTGGLIWNANASH